MATCIANSFGNNMINIEACIKNIISMKNVVSELVMSFLNSQGNIKYIDIEERHTHVLKSGT